MSMTLQDWIPLIRDILEGVFYFVIGIITISTYLQARKTIFQPIKVEVFKEQIHLFSELLSFFMGKGETVLRDEFAFQKTFFVNAMRFFDDYAELFFDADIDRETRPYNGKDCPSSIISEEHLIKYFSPAVDHTKPEQSEDSQEKPDPRTRAAIWSNYEYYQTFLPKKHTIKIEELRKIIDSPLLPRELVTLLEEYLRIIDQNVSIIPEILTKASGEMPEKYPNSEQLMNSSLDWLNFRYNDKISNLEDTAKEIIEYIRNYYISDKIFE